MVCWPSKPCSSLSRDALGCVALLPVNPPVRLQNGVNYAGEGLNLRLMAQSSACGAALAACSPGASHWPASCAPCPGAGRIPMRPPVRSSPPPSRLGERESTSPTRNIHDTFHRLNISTMKDDGWYSFPPPEPGDRAARPVHFLSALHTVGRRLLHCARCVRRRATGWFSKSQVRGRGYGSPHGVSPGSSVP